MENPNRLTPDYYQTAAAQTAYYEKFANPTETLRYGLADEVVELIDEAYGIDYWDGSISEELVERPLHQETWKGELGDILWYVSEIARAHSLPLAQIIASAEERSAGSETRLVHIADFSQAPEALAKYNFVDKPVSCLAMLGGRVRDAMVTSACLYAEDLDIVTALQDLWTGASIIAKNHDLTFNEIAQTNLEKLDTRARKPHTITHLEEGKLSTFARRKRMLLATLAMKD